jgi:2-dehydro-3-deoxygalactonokinase
MAIDAPALIAIDWGSSSFRGYLLARAGVVLDEIASADGVSAVTPNAFPSTLMRLVGVWMDRHPDLPIIASGMVGSRHGWREAPYVKCPAEPREIAAHLVTVDAGRRRVHLAPGLSSEDEAGEPDVIRGEEVEILGIAEFGGRLIVLPGSHSKWAVVDRGRVLRFKTFVTGELFSAIKDHTIVGAFARVAPPRTPGKAFAQGVSRGASTAGGAANGGLLGALFGARSLPLMGKLREDEAGDYLSGLLIGAEIAEGRRLFPDEAPRVAGAEPLVARYLAAFAALELAASPASPHAAARGLHLLARQAGLV